MNNLSEKRREETGLPGIITNEDGLVTARFLRIDEERSLGEYGEMALSLFLSASHEMKEA